MTKKKIMYFFIILLAVLIVSINVLGVILNYYGMEYRDWLISVNIILITIFILGLIYLLLTKIITIINNKIENNSSRKLIGIVTMIFGVLLAGYIISISFVFIVFSQNEKRIEIINGEKYVVKNSSFLDPLPDEYYRYINPFVNSNIKIYSEDIK